MSIYLPRIESLYQYGKNHNNIIKIKELREVLLGNKLVPIELLLRCEATLVNFIFIQLLIFKLVKR